MKIIKINPLADGSRPPIQDWSKKTPPDGYAFCPDEFVAVFYSTSPAGFVNIEVAGDTVVAMTINQEAYDAYVARNPEPSDPEPSEEDDTASMLIDHEYRLTLLELGLSE